MYFYQFLKAFDNVFIVCSVLETIRKHFGNFKNYNSKTKKKIIQVYNHFTSMK